MGIWVAAITALVLGSPGREPLLTGADRASFARLQRSLGGVSGLAVSPLGRGRPVERLGALRTGVAWSTSKVPVAVAVETMASGHPSRSVQSLMRRAISGSDNAAAEALWRSLGPPATAGHKVERVLAAAGDSGTRVQTRRVRPGFTAFGQTQWPIASQQRFIAGLSCVRYSGRVLGLMGRVVAGQRWGLGTLGAAARFKGGWGPGTDGRYLVRQMGIVRLSNGRSIAMTVATIAPGGGFAAGARNLTRIARWLVGHVDGSAVTPRRC